MPVALIVDDSAVERRILAGLLRKETNWRIEEATDGRDAFEQISRRPPDVVVTDLQMPEMNGLELVQAVRRDVPLVPVVLVTGQGSEEIAVKALEAGAASYVPKSELNKQLVDTLESVMAAAGERQSMSQLMRCVTEWRANFSLPNDPSILLSLVAHLQRTMCAMALFDDSVRLRIGVALEEALLNAAYHGNLEVSSKLREENHSQYYELARKRMSDDPYRSRRVSVEVELTPDYVEYIVEDEGPGFDPGELPDPTDPANLDRPCGRGLLLMRTFMDTLEYNDTGNRVRMRKNVEQAESDGDDFGSDGYGPDDYDGDEPEPSVLTVDDLSELEADDAPSVVTV